MTSGDAALEDAAEPSVRVLHVDDDPSLLDLAADVLAREAPHFEVVAAERAEDGLSVLASEPIDCVVSDYDMPGMDGLAFLEAVRERHGDLPFVLFTGKGSEEIASEAISAGVTDYLQKESGLEQYELLANRVETYVDRRRTAEALAESQRQLSTLLSNLPGMAYRCANEPGWPMEFVSDGSEALSGHPPDALESGRVVWGEDVIHPEDRDEVWAAVQEALSSGESFRLTYRIRRADEAIRWVWEQGVGVHDDGEIVALEGFITDVTERRKAEMTARETARRLEAIVEASPEPIVALDADGNVTLWNDAAESAFGWAAEEVLGGPLPMVPEDREAEHREIFERVLSGESVTDLELVREDAEGEPVSYRLSTAPLTDSDGNVVGVMSVAAGAGDGT